MYLSISVAVKPRPAHAGDCRDRDGRRAARRSGHFSVSTVVVAAVARRPRRRTRRGGRSARQTGRPCRAPHARRSAWTPRPWRLRGWRGRYVCVSQPARGIRQVRHGRRHHGAGKVRGNPRRPPRSSRPRLHTCRDAEAREIAPVAVGAEAGGCSAAASICGPAAGLGADKARRECAPDAQPMSIYSTIAEQSNRRPASDMPVMSDGELAKCEPLWNITTSLIARCRSSRHGNSPGGTRKSRISRPYLGCTSY